MQDQVKSLYRVWAENNQCIFLVEIEEVAAATISSYPWPIRRQVSGKGLVRQNAT